MRYFEQLRRTLWQPTFEWLQDAEAVADRINSFHEDYPFRVGHTLEVLQSFAEGSTVSFAIPNTLLLDIHRYVFQDQDYAGRWRTGGVRVGSHTPPPSSALPALMWQFEQAHGTVGTIGALEDWYFDFETIHPFEDGNGRVGGIMAAAWSHRMVPDKGWYTVGQ